jgi:hypothetical protein
MLDVDARGYGIVSNVLHGLQQELEKFPRPGWNTSAHSEVLETLINTSLIRKLFDVNESVAEEFLAVSCPVVDASGLRLMRWVPLLLESMTPADTHDCLIERNAWGETSAHGAASSKASGFARIILRATNPQTLPHAPWMAEIAKVDISSLATQAAMRKEVFFANIVGAADSSDLAQLLRAGDAAFPSPDAMNDWISMEDNLGRTPVATACSQGRWPAIQLLLDAIRSSSNSSVAPTSPDPLLSTRSSPLHQAVRTCVTHLSRNGFRLDRATCVDNEDCSRLLRSHSGLAASHAIDGGHAPEAVALAESALDALEQASASSCAAAAVARGRGPIAPAQRKQCATSRTGWGVPIAEHVQRVRIIVKQVPLARRARLIGPAETETAADSLRECLLHGDAPCLLRGDTPWHIPSPELGLTRFAETQSVAAKRRARSHPSPPSKRPPGAAVVGRSAFLAVCGGLPTRLSTVPYASSYGLDTGTPSTLGQHCRENMGIKGMRRLATWLLDSSGTHGGGGASVSHPAALDGWRPQYSFQALPAALIQRVSPTPSNETIALALREHIAELIVGPPGSGAMSHFHGPAVNALAVGSKLWIVFTPACASFSMRHPAEWLQRLPQWIREHPRCANPWMFVQRAGESVAVPRHFGHAVFNLQDTVAIAYEQP